MNKLVRIFTILLSAATVALVNTACRPCHGYMAMQCEHSTHIAEAVLAAVIVLNAVTLFIKKSAVHPITALFNIAAGVFLQFIPVFGRCQVASMSCNMKTFPLLRITGLLIAAFSAIALIINVVKIVSRRRTHANAQ